MSSSDLTSDTDKIEQDWRWATNTVEGIKHIRSSCENLVCIVFGKKGEGSMIEIFKHTEGVHNIQDGGIFNMMLR